MRFAPPAYIPARILQDPAIHYRWDDSDFYWVFEEFDTATKSRLDGVAEPAVHAFTIAVSEWIFFRLVPMDRSSNAWLFLEAAWCANVDRRYCQTLEVARDGPLGPVKGPILAAENIVNSELYESLESPEKPVLEPSQLSNLVEHVYGSPPEFHSWRDWCLDRLTGFYPAPDPFQDIYGEISESVRVPREAFDPDYPFRPEETPRLLDRLLRSVDPMANPFLRAPKELVEDGFEGVPYTYPPIQIGSES
jgi:hypothetical protein